MSEKQWRKFGLFCLVSLAFFLGMITERRLHGVPKQVLGTADSPSSTSVTVTGFCSDDGKHWWKSRDDGQCYEADKP